MKAETYKHWISIDFNNVPEDAGFHATCYRRFIDEMKHNETQGGESVLKGDAGSTAGSTS